MTDETAAAKLAMRLLREHDLTDWIFAISDLGPTTWGCCDHDDKIISLSRGCPDCETTETILHEVAHALAGPTTADHGKEWAATARGLGCKVIDRCRDDYSPNFPRTND